MNSDTILKWVLGILPAILVFLASASWVLFGYASQVDQNTDDIFSIVQTLQITRIDDDISNLNKERRELRRELMGDPENGLISEQIDEIKDDVRRLEIIRDCVTKPESKICE